MSILKYGLMVGLMILCVSSVQGAATSIQAYYQIGSQIQPANTELEIPFNAEKILFDIGDQNEETSPHGHRVQYRLNGVDSNWHQKRDEMSVTVIFYDALGDQVGQQIYLINGKSPGWSGSITQSTFTHHHEELVVPPGAERLSMVLSSAGPPTTVGIFVLADLLVQENDPVQTILDTRPFLQGSTDALSRWIRTGRRPSMAKLVPKPGASSPDQAFCLLDDDPTSYGEWTSVWQTSPKLTPGKSLSIDWNEIYDTGMVKYFRVAYPLPAPGRYQLTVQEVDALDHPLPVENMVEITVLPPYWKSPWFWTKCALALGLILFLAIGYLRYSRNRLQQQRLRLVEQERLRIARDLHDELGARITHISLMSSFASTNTSPADSSIKLREISTMARDLMASLSEVVWVVNPEKDRLESMIDYLCQIIRQLCQPANLKCYIDECTEKKDYAVSSQVRHHIVLAVKEAVNNAIKHSGATELHTAIRFQSPHLTITISDNGKGLPTDLQAKGNGIKNMRERLSLMNGRIDINSAPGKGTRIRFEINLPS